MIFGSTARVRVFAAIAAGGLLAQPLAAQFSGLLRSAPRDAVNDAQRDDGCAEGKSRSTGSKVAGGLLGRLAGRAASSAGVSSWVPVAEVADQLTGAIACKLDPQEQRQAADATLQATRSDDSAASDELVPVGSSAVWTSASRDEVSGSSTVSARDDQASGGDCITVTDVIIVRGEETTAEKRMCRPVGSRRYSLVT